MENKNIWAIWLSAISLTISILVGAKDLLHSHLYKASTRQVILTSFQSESNDLDGIEEVLKSNSSSKNKASAVNSFIDDINENYKILSDLDIASLPVAYQQNYQIVRLNVRVDYVNLRRIYNENVDDQNEWHLNYDETQSLIDKIYELKTSVDRYKSSFKRGETLKLNEEGWVTK